LNFFAAQDQARKTTRRLVVLYALAVAFVVFGVALVVGVTSFKFGYANKGYSVADYLQADWQLLSGTIIVSVLFILGATLYKTSQLSSGGGRVAMDMGGTLVSSDTMDPLRRRLRNVVEEMSIASGVPTPDIYVLEQEAGINAFAAGYSPGDAVIAVTKGTLELLERDELQGVIAHEFSHILNGDMRLNIRLMGVLFGIMVLGMIGRMVIRGGHHASFISRGRNRNAPVVFIIGLALALLGAVGVFIARIIKAGVSRQREYLADASAVQFTRQSQGLANALKKIGGYPTGSLFKSADPEEISHMLFGTGAKLSGMLATHPALVERIRVLDPAFKESDYPVVDDELRETVLKGTTASIDAGIASAFVAGAVSAEAIGDSVGNPELQHVEYATQIRGAIPDLLYDAAHSSENAYLLVIALILDRSGASLDRQLHLAEEKLGPRRAELLRRYYAELATASAEFRMPLLEIAFPALRLRPAPQLTFLIELTGEMAELDGNIDLYEYCFYRVLKSNLGQAMHPAGRRTGARVTRNSARDAATTLLALVASAGHDNDVQRREAYHAGAAKFGTWAANSTYAPEQDYSVAILDRCLDILTKLKSKGRSNMLEAISAVVLFDDHITVTETELVRAICASLDCPLPPILTNNSKV
jgi:Zn-dependent protease with chaperone function